MHMNVSLEFSIMSQLNNLFFEFPFPCFLFIIIAHRKISTLEELYVTQNVCSPLNATQYFIN